MNTRFRVLPVIVIFMVLTSMNNISRKDSFFSLNSSVHNDSMTCDSLVSYARQYLNRPYCYGSNVPKCFDCSGFVQFVFSKFGTNLPNSSGIIALQGKFIRFKNATTGDLVFFNGRNSNSETIGHVGIVTRSEKDTIYFIHASVQAGVIISNTLESYYSKRLLFVKRIALNNIDPKH